VGSMKVVELAKELNTTSDEVLQTLKSLKLKAKDEDQELSSVVASVVKTEFKNGRPASELPSPPPKKLGPKRNDFAVLPEEPRKATKQVSSSSSDEGASKDQEAKIIVKRKILKKVPVTEVKKSDDERIPTLDPSDESAETTTKDAVSAPGKNKSKLSAAPIITVKPLIRRKKRTGGKDEHESVGSGLGVHDAVQSDDQSSLGGSSAVSELTPENDVEDLAELEIKMPIIVKDFGTRIGQKPGVVLKSLMKMGVFAHINQSLDGEVVRRLAQEFGYKLTALKTQEEQLIDDHRQEEEDPASLKSRAPVITFMGHVDHGKTSLVDWIRKTKVAGREHGGITQHMGAYSVEIDRGRITILDTPGHAAFTAMRARGAHITDIIVLVIAADEGVMPQTREAIDHALAANVPIVVALNKIDKSSANPDRVKQQLSEIDLTPEDWGGKTIVQPVSALTGQGIDDLLESILLESEILELKANPDKAASGIVVEAHLSQGKGTMTTLIVQGGTLREGDVIVVGAVHGKIRAMLDDHGRLIKQAGPSMPVEVMGLNDVPQAGDKFYSVLNERLARDITMTRQEDLKNKRLTSLQKVSLENLYSHLEDGLIRELNVIIKSDVQGSLEALKEALEKIPNDKVRLKFIHMAVGDVNASDVLLAAASKAIIIAFHVDVDSRGKEELEVHPVDVREYRIIYDAVDDIHQALEGMLEPKVKKNFQCRLEVRNVFKLTKSGVVAGCFVAKGKAMRKANLDVIRNGDVVFSGKLSTLKRFKDDVREVNEGMECGVSIDNYNDFQSGDIIETYVLESVKVRL
jgi:translation initiation factor IF-2